VMDDQRAHQKQAVLKALGRSEATGPAATSDALASFVLHPKL
jgi:hypothetical protein